MAKHEFVEAKRSLEKRAARFAGGRVSADDVHLESLVESSEMMKQAQRNKSSLYTLGWNVGQFRNLHLPKHQNDWHWHLEERVSAWQSRLYRTRMRLVMLDNHWDCISQLFH
jgi:hypothetical protein